MRRDAQFVILDLETTGLSVYRDAVIEVAAVRFEPGKGVIDEFSMLVKPRCPVSDGAQRVHGITGAYAEKHGQEPKRAFAELREFIGENALVAHNGLAFDFPMLLNEMHGVDIEPGANRLIDTLVLAPIYLRSPRFSMEAICRAYGIRNEAAHRALADARATAQVLGLICEQENDPDVLWQQSYAVSWAELTSLPAGFEMLEAALTAECAIDIEYKGRDKPAGERRVEPLFLKVGRDRRLYLTAMCDRDGFAKDFRVDRIRRLIRLAREQ